MRFHIHTPQELIQYLQQMRANATIAEKQAKSQKDRRYHSGQIAAYNDGIFAIEEHLKTLAEDAATTE